jgi:hypothetical protein
MALKIIRTLCYFAEHPHNRIINKLDHLQSLLENRGFVVQTRRICFPPQSISAIDSWAIDPSIYLSIGTLDHSQAREAIKGFLSAKNIAFNLDLSQGVEMRDVELLLEIVQRNSKKTFSFAFTFNNAPASPFFPSASYQEPGFSLGLQPTDLAEGCSSLPAWLAEMKRTWEEISDCFADHPDFLGIDSSIAPLFDGNSSLVHFIKKLCGSFSKATTTDTFLRITEFIKKNNPKPVGLCGLMFPCLEDFELAEEYEQGRFSIERNIFLAMHSGLGVDTYPLGIDEAPERIRQILELLRGLSLRYGKPLSARFVSDGKARVGTKTNLENQYLKDVIVREL